MPTKLIKCITLKKLHQYYAQISKNNLEVKNVSIKIQSGYKREVHDVK